MLGSLERGRETFTPISHRLTSSLSFSQEFSTLEDAVKFDQECLIAIGLRTKEDTPTLLDDASAATTFEVSEPEPVAEDRDVEPHIAPTPPRRSERLMRKKAKAAVAEVAALAAESVPLKETGHSVPSSRRSTIHEKDSNLSGPICMK